MLLDPFENSINLFERCMLDSNLSWGGVFKIYRHLMMLQITDPSQWYQIWLKLQCVWLKKQVIAPMSVRAGGAGGCHRPPPPSPSQILGNSDFFGQQEKFWQNQFLQKFPCFVSSFFFLWKRYFFIWSLSRRGKVSFIFGLWVLSIILNNTYSLCRYLQGRRSMSSAVVEMPTWPYRPYASVVVKKVSTAYGKYCW